MDLPWAFSVCLDSRSLLLFTLVLLLVALGLRSRRPRSFPPGPWALPLVGNILSLDFNNLHNDMTKLAEQYGNVYSLKMGPVWMVVLNGFSTLQEGLSKGDHMTDRPAFPIHTDVLPDLGIIFANGYSWKQQRQFALSTLKYFGVGKKSLESSIMEEFRYMSKEIASHKGKPFNLHFLMNNAVSNIICSLIFGHRFDYKDEKFLQLITLLDKGVQIEGSIWAQLYNAFPVLMRRLPGPHHTLQKVYRDIIDLMKTEINKHREDWNPSDPRDFIDCYLTEIQKHQDKRDDKPDASGTETTSTTLRWGVLYMAKYTEIQEKVQEEIDRRSDRRLHNPKGITVMPNLTSVLFDKNEWETPNTFNPGHFLNKEGKFVKRAAFIPFSVGKRVCLGENLARMELFLLFTSFLQRFTFSMPPGVEAVFKPRFSISLSPQPYQICATLREK
ncbi:Cytochrome P450 2J2 [Dissostichus eleginoides]|uniref:Cytochrome P450 2J2 n=1 Tax=Dissostichus eleginoides TaxID=100907 RepID=A0AAD9C9G6_DISEL|nr:Cytochrome P450 2J2 [Dissostichus eleginoides]